MPLKPRRTIRKSARPEPTQSDDMPEILGDQPNSRSRLSVNSSSRSRGIHFRRIQFWGYVPGASELGRNQRGFAIYRLGRGRLVGALSRDSGAPEHAGGEGGGT